MRISDWSSDVCSSDLPNPLRAKLDGLPTGGDEFRRQVEDMRSQIGRLRLKAAAFRIAFVAAQMETIRISEEHTSELQSLIRIAYAVFCLNKKKQNDNPSHQKPSHPTPTT